MATILEFPSPRMRGAQQDGRPAPAEIVIFPGVRIERAEFNLAERIAPVRRRRQPMRSPVTEADE